MIKDHKINSVSYSVGWNVRTNKDHSRVIYLLNDGRTHNGPKFKCRRLARVYAKQNYNGMMILDYQFQPIQPVEYINITYKYKWDEIKETHKL